MHADIANEPQHAPSVVAGTAFAFAYWVVFMGALTPGNISIALDAGMTVDPVREIVRLCAAGLLGASAMPLLLRITARTPLARPHLRRNLAIQAGVAIGLAAVLVVSSCFLVAWAGGRLVPERQEILDELFANLFLLTLCIALLLFFIQAGPRPFGGGVERRRGWAPTLTIGERGRTTIVDLGTVEWIEAQGNYQALHSSDGILLHRATSTAVEALLDPARFVRIHRRHLVAIDKVRSIEPLQGGDANVVLQSGARLRQSRQYRGALRAAVTRNASQ